MLLPSPLRRRLLVHGAVWLLIPPFIGAAQERRFRIGILGNEDTPPWQGLRQGLRDAGYVDGQNVTLEWRWSDGRPERFPELARALVESKVDVIVASSTQAVRAAKDATSTIPIVIAVASYPEKIGLVQSLAHPGGNVTGLTNIAPELNTKKLQLLKEIAPQVSSLAVLTNSTSPVEKFGSQDVLDASRAMGLRAEPVDVRTPDDLPAAFATVTSKRLDALLVFGNPVNFRGRQLISEFALKRRLPSVFEERLFVEVGGLLSYAPSFHAMFYRAAGFVDRIRKGAKPADLPVERPRRFELVINAKTARALGLTVPPSLLLQADQVVD